VIALDWFGFKDNKTTDVLSSKKSRSTAINSSVNHNKSCGDWGHKKEKHE